MSSRPPNERPRASAIPQPEKLRHSAVFLIFAAAAPAFRFGGMAAVLIGIPRWRAMPVLYQSVQKPTRKPSWT
jgi:hypothetical protein